MAQLLVSNTKEDTSVLVVGPTSRIVTSSDRVIGYQKQMIQLLIGRIGGPGTRVGHVASNDSCVGSCSLVAYNPTVTDAVVSE